MTALGSRTSYAYGLNEQDDVVGQVLVRGAGGRSAYHAFLYSGGKMRDLNRLIPAGSGILLSAAQDINNNGWIVATGTNAAGQSRGFVLIPSGRA